MNRKHLAILATAGLVWGVSPVHAVDGTSSVVGTGGVTADAANAGASKLQARPTDVSAARKRKGKGGTKGGEAYMTIKMQDALVTSYRSQGGRPKGVLSGGLLGTTGGNFNPNPPSPTGAPAPPATSGAGVIK